MTVSRNLAFADRWWRRPDGSWGVVPYHYEEDEARADHVPGPLQPSNRCRCHTAHDLGPDSMVECRGVPGRRPRGGRTSPGTSAGRGG